MAAKKTPRRNSEAVRKSASNGGASKRPALAGTFPVVGIGASAGGLEALEELFRAMPPDTGMAFVVITHQHPGHTSLLPELLGKVTPLTVVQVADGMKLEPDHVYVSAPGGSLEMPARFGSAQPRTPPAERLSNHLGQGLVTLA